MLKADLRAAGARVAVADANLAEAQTMLGYTKLQAPFDGVVISRNVDHGHFVQPAGGIGAKPLGTVARTDRMRISLDVPEMEAGLVDVGDPAVLRVQALRGKEIMGEIARITWSLDAGNRSLRAEVDVPNENSALRPYRRHRTRPPRQCAYAANDCDRAKRGRGCLCGHRGWQSHASLRRESGLRVGPDTEIVSGLTESSDVITIRPEAVTDGQRVETLLSNK